MDDRKRATLLEEAYQIVEQEILLLCNTKQRGQLRLVRRQIVIARKFKQDGRCGQIGFSNFLKQSIFLIIKLITELFNNHRS
jgi:hypothetical protein